MDPGCGDLRSSLVHWTYIRRSRDVQVVSTFVLSSSRHVHSLEEDCSPPPSKLARNGRRRSRPSPPPDRESPYLRTDRHPALRGSNQEVAHRFKGKGSPREGGDWPGETVLNNVGRRAGLRHDIPSCCIFQSIATQSCGNIDQITDPKYSISAGYVADP